MVGSRWIPTRPHQDPTRYNRWDPLLWGLPLPRQTTRNILDKIRADVTDAIEATSGNRAVGGPYTSPYE